MLNRLLIVLAIVVALLVPGQAMAWDGFSQSVRVRVLEPYFDGQFIATFVDSSGVTVNLCSGPPPGSFAATWGAVHAGDGHGMTTDGVKALYAALLAAKMSGATLNVYANNDSASPSTGMCAIGVIDLF